MEAANSTWSRLRIAGIVVFAVGLIGYIFMGSSTHNLTATGSGSIAQVETCESTSRKDDKTTYRFLVSFKGEDNERHEAWDINTHKTRVRDTGDPVQVRYDPANPEAGCMIVADASSLDATKSLLLAVGGLGAVLFVIALLGTRISAQQAAGVAIPKQARIALWTVAALVVVASAAFLAKGVIDSQKSQKTVADVTEGSTVGRERLSVTNVGESQTGSFTKLGPDKVKGYLIVRNDTHETVDLTATFTYKSNMSQYADDLDTVTDTVPALAPNETVLLRGVSSAKAAKFVSYKLRCSASKATTGSLTGRVSIEEQSVGDEELVLAVDQHLTRRRASGGHAS